jgi:hypothetical protein
MDKFPVDFEKKAKEPPPADGRGYPYRISAKDLMTNFKFAALQVDEADDSGLRLQIDVEGEERTISIVKPEITGALIFKDCEGAEVARIDWVNGMITTEGEQEIEAGCDGTSSV